MNVEEVVQYWLTTATDDWRVAQHLFESEDYAYALFFGHLYLEKILKALVVQRTEAHASFTHNLSRLAEEGGLSLTEEQEDTLDDVTTYNLEARYPNQQLEFKRRCTREFCELELKRIKEMVKWVKSQIES